MRLKSKQVLAVGLMFGAINSPSAWAFGPSLEFIEAQHLLAVPYKTPEVGTVVEIADAKKRGLELRAEYTEGLEQWLPAADGSNELPESILGIWWLEGNPARGGQVLSLSSATYEAEAKEWTWDFSGPLTYGYSGDEDGIKAFKVGLKARLYYKLTFNEEQTELRVVPEVDVFGRRVRVPQFMSDFTAHLDSEGNWIRHSRVFGRNAPDYVMRRIVDKEGRRVEPAYSQFLEQAGPISYLVFPALNHIF